MSVYTREQVEAKIANESLEGWYFDEDGGWLRRKYSTDGWPATLMLVSAIGYLCEAAWHHADLSVTWGKVWVKLKTHSEGGITEYTTAHRAALRASREVLASLSSARPFAPSPARP